MLNCAQTFDVSGKIAMFSFSCLRNYFQDVSLQPVIHYPFKFKVKHGLNHIA